MKVVWLDFWYDAAFRAANTRDYEALHRFSHGTSNYWDIALRAAGHESDTLIGNAEHDIIGKAVSMQPDVICSQNVGLYYPALIRARGFKGKLVAFCSYAAERRNLEGWDVVFSSFRWLVDEMNAAGLRAVYLPLAFGRAVLERVEVPPERDIDVAFFGGLGSKIWSKGTADIAAVAERVPDFRWWGYRVGALPESLNRTYCGEAWGLNYFRLLMRTKIVINRHGEIAKGFGNNMRQYEALGAGAILLTDSMGGIRPLTDAAEYRSVDGCCDTIRAWLHHDYERGNDGQAEVLAKHCYENRVPAFLEAAEHA